MDDFKKIKIVFSDIDGTLVTSSKKVTKNTKIAIERLSKKDIYFVLVSGRDHFYTAQKSKESSASNIIISTNGALVYDVKNNNYIYSNFIKPKKVEKICTYCGQNKIGLVITTIDKRYYNKYNKDYKVTKESVLLDENDIDYNCIKTLQITLDLKGFNNLEQLKNLIKKEKLDITYFSKSFFLDDKNSKYTIDINNKKVNKGIAIKRLLKYLKLKKENALCFGDYVNDVEMFNACKIKVSMKNASDEIKNIADYITESNDNEGVANFIDKYL